MYKRRAEQFKFANNNLTDLHRTVLCFAQDIKRAMHLWLVLVLGLVYSAAARNCLHPTDLVDFDFEKYKGLWHEVGYRTGNASLVSDFRKITCVDIEFKPNGNLFDVEADYLFDGKETQKKGKYTLLENKKSAFSLDYVDSPVYSEYIYRIVCTDYTSYSVGYSCSQLQEGKSSDVIFLNARDRSKYQDLLAKEEVKKCLRDQLRARPDKIKPIPQNNC